jgi:S-adenosylmethionine uptake transporter
VQDATVKWLVVTVPVPEILLFRSFVIILIAALIGRGAAFRSLAHSRRKTALALRAALILGAWLSYYNAAAHLALAELTTLYFAAPIVAVVLATVILKERIIVVRWLAVLGGFAGVVLAADPGHGSGGLLPIGLALFAACCWGLSVVLVRVISRSESTAAQMLVSNGLFALACLPMLLWSAVVPTPQNLVLMLALGLFGGLGQWFLYEGFRYAPASAVAPVEYTGLVWAFLYGFAIWGEVPAARVVGGAALIVAASVLLILYESRRSRRRSGADQGCQDLPVPDEADRGTLPISHEERA